MQVKKDPTFMLVNSLSDALTVRRLRNECRTFLTNYSKHISPLRQIYWYFSYYKKAVRSGVYRIFIVRSQIHKRQFVDEADSGSSRTSRRLEQEETMGVSPWFFIARSKNAAIGYGALHLKNKQLYITECVGAKYRRQGYGMAILKYLISIAQKEKLPLVAQIWSSNKSSIALHEKCGFNYISTSKGIKKYVY